MDMWTPYRDAVRAVLPKATIVVDNGARLLLRGPPGEEALHRGPPQGRAAEIRAPSRERDLRPHSGSRRRPRHDDAGRTVQRGKSALFSGLAMVLWVAAFGVTGPLLPRFPARIRELAAPAGYALLALAYLAISTSLALGHRLDRAPLGRNEGDEWWFRRHDEYGAKERNR